MGILRRCMGILKCCMVRILRYCMGMYIGICIDMQW